MSEIRLPAEEITRRIKIGINAAKHYDKVAAKRAQDEAKKNGLPQTEAKTNESDKKEKPTRTFVSAIFETIASEKYVRINLPKPSAKELKPVPAHNLLVFQDWKMDAFVGLDIEAHYFINDLPVAGINGRLKPRVVRHFYAETPFWGQMILASVAIKSKTDLITNEKMVIIDINQIFPRGPVEVTNILRIGTKANGSEGEALVPHSDLCVRFEKIRPQKILATKAKTEVIFTPKTEITTTAVATQKVGA